MLDIQFQLVLTKCIHLVEHAAPQSTVVLNRLVCRAPHRVITQCRQSAIHPSFDFLSIPATSCAFLWLFDLWGLENSR